MLVLELVQSSREFECYLQAMTRDVEVVTPLLVSALVVLPLVRRGRQQEKWMLG